MTGKKRKTVWIAVFVLLAVSVLIRIPHIRSDPPRLLVDLSGSAGIYFDEGMYTHNARNKILFHRWITDEWNPLIYNAPLTGLYYFAFRVFGIKIITVKGLNILFGSLGVLLFFLIALRYLSEMNAFILSILFSFNFYWLAYNRIGLLENFSAFSFIALFALFEWVQVQKKGYFWLGFFAGMVILAKYLFFFFLIAVLLAVLHHTFREKQKKPIILFLSGLTIVFLTWLFSLYLPFQGSFSKIGSGWGALSIPKNPGQLFHNLLQQPLSRYLPLMPLIAVAGFLFLGIFITGQYRRRFSFLSGEWLVFFWLTGGIAVLPLLQYHPMRYYLPVIPAFYLAVMFLLRRFLQQGAVDGKNVLDASASIIIAVLIGFPFFKALVRSPSAFFSFPIWIRLGIFAGFILLLFLLFFRYFLPRVPILLLLSVLSLSTSLHLFQHHLLARPHYNLEMAASEVRKLPAGSVILGQEAPRLALESKLKAFPAFEGWFNDQDPFRTLRPTHLLVLDRWGRREFNWLEARFPETMKKMRLLRRFRIWDTTVTLYSFSGRGDFP